MILVQIADAYASLVDTVVLETAARRTLEHQAISQDADLTLVVTGDAQIKQLNLHFREMNAPTDVLSFPADFTDPDSGTPYLGDVLISFPQGQAQANAAGHTIEEELQLLTAHGVLHLLGHDHASADDKTRMWNAQAEILERLGCSNLKPP